MPDRRITSARIDVPLASTYAMLFVGPEQADWHPWWRQLFEHLQRIPEQPLEWRFEPVQSVFVARPNLSATARQDLGRFLRTAPASEIVTHTTLNRAVELPADDMQRLGVLFFSRD